MKNSQKYLILIVIIGWTAGYFLGNQIGWTELVMNIPFLTMGIAAILAAYSFLFHIVMHEFGHLIFGKATGYQLIYFQAPFFYYDGYKKTFSQKKARAGGLLGQCLMSPPEKGTVEEKPYFLYLSGGLILNFLTALLLYIGGFVLPIEWGFVSFLFSLAPLYLFLTNVVSFGYTDGRVIREIRKSPLTKKLYFKQLETSALFEQGKTYPEIPEDFFEEVKTGEAKQSPLGEYSIMVEYSRLLSHQRFEEADQLLQEYNATWDYMKSPYVRNIASETLFCHAIFGRREEAKKWWEHIQSMSGLKLYYDRSTRIQAAYTLFIERDIEKTRTLIQERKQSPKLLGLNNAEEALEDSLIEWLETFVKQSHA